MDPEWFFDGHPVGLEVFRRVSAILAAHGPVEVRTTRSQVAFRRRRGFAYLWLPRMYLGLPAAPVVLSIASSRRIDSTRFKEVVHPARATWMHHLEVRSVDELDDVVAGWLGEAYEAAESGQT